MDIKTKRIRNRYRWGYNMKLKLQDGNIYYKENQKYLLVGAKESDIVMNFEDAVHIKQGKESSYYISYYVIELDDNLTYRENIQRKDFIYVPYPFFLSAQLYKRLSLSNYKIDLLKRKMLDVPDFISVKEFRKRYNQEVNVYLNKSIKTLEKIKIGQIITHRNTVDYVYYGIDLEQGKLVLNSTSAASYFCFISLDYESLFDASFEVTNQVVPREKLNQDAIQDNQMQLRKLAC